MAELKSLPPPTWVDIADTDQLNKWIGDTLKPVQESVDKGYAVLVNLLSVASEALDVVSTFLTGLQDPLTAILNQIIALVEGILKDLRNAGVYATWDSAFKTLPNFSNFAGGYRRVTQDLTRKLTDPKDPSRPNFTRQSSVVMLMAYVDLGVTGLGFDPVEFAKKGKTGFSALDAFLNLFKAPQVSAGAYPPPQLQPPSYVARVPTDAGFYEYRIEDSNELKADTEITGIVAKWSNPPSKKLNFFDLDLPPASYVVTVTTRSRPLPLFREVEEGASTSDSATPNSKITPVFLKDEKGGEGQRATTLIANRTTSETASKLFAKKEGGDKVDLSKFIDETKSYYVDTSNFGAVFAGVEYELEIEIDDLPSKLYDIEKETYSEDIEAYYIYVSSHNSELNDFDEGDEITEEQEDFAFKLNSEQVAKVELVGGDKSSPSFSSPVPISTKLSLKQKFISALRESLFYFIMAEEYRLSEASSLSDKPYVLDDQRNKIYSLFGVDSAQSLYARFKGDRDDVENYREELEDMVDNAVTRFLGRGMPSQRVLESYEAKIDTILRTDEESDVIYYDLLGNDFDEDTSILEQTGIYPGYPEYGAEITEGERQNLSLFNDSASTTIFHSVVDTFYVLFQHIPVDKYASSIDLLGLTKETPDKVSAEGEWVFARLLADGLPDLEEFLEGIRSALKSLVEGIGSIIDSVLKYIALLQQRIESIRRFITRLKALIDALLGIRLPGGVRYLLTEADGTEGLVSALSSAENQPVSENTVYSTYATFVFGGLPSILVDFLLSLIDSQGTIDVVNEVFTGNKDGETDNQIFLGTGTGGGGE